MKKIFEGIICGLAGLLVAAASSQKITVKELLPADDTAEKTVVLEKVLHENCSVSPEETRKNTVLLRRLKNGEEYGSCQGYNLNGGYISGAKHCFDNGEDAVLIYKQKKLVGSVNKIAFSNTDDLALLWSNDLAGETDQNKPGACLPPKEMETGQEVWYTSLYPFDRRFRKFRSENIIHFADIDSNNGDIITGNVTGAGYEYRKIDGSWKPIPLVNDTDLPVMSGLSGSGVFVRQEGKGYLGGIMIKAFPKFDKNIGGLYASKKSEIVSAEKMREFLTDYVQTRNEK